MNFSLNSTALTAGKYFWGKLWLTRSKIEAPKSTILLKTAKNQPFISQNLKLQKSTIFHSQNMQKSTAFHLKPSKINHLHPKR